MPTLSLGFSTCPNDTFIFDAMVHHKIDTFGYHFDLLMGDVEELNQMALKSELDITKLSYHAYAYLWSQYAILNSGSALGKNNGPLLISKKKIYPDEIEHLKIAIPGVHTTANLLFSIAFPKATNKKEYLFSDIETAILDQEVDAGLIIHENRFTYLNKGLIKIVDLGEFWENSTHQTIPLGGIVVKRSLSNQTQVQINQMIRKSIEYAYANPSSATAFMKQYAQEMQEDIMKQHTDLYVNNFTFDLGQDGQKSIEMLYTKAFDLGLIPSLPQDVFVTPY
jgi:1,4-dihydroxy-6-naphthoate synthase